MSETKDQILSQEELEEEIKNTKRKIYDILISLSNECEGLESCFPNLEKLDDGNYIPPYFVQDKMLDSLIEKAIEIKTLGEKLDFLRYLKNKKAP